MTLNYFGSGGLPEPDCHDVLSALERDPDRVRPAFLNGRLLFDRSDFSRPVMRMAVDGV